MNLTNDFDCYHTLLFIGCVHRLNGDEQPLVVADEWELPHSSLKLGKVLGSGAFGKVILGRVSRALLRHRGLPEKYSEPPSPSELKDENDDPLMAPVAIKMLKGG